MMVAVGGATLAPNSPEVGGAGNCLMSSLRTRSESKSLACSALLDETDAGGSGEGDTRAEPLATGAGVGAAASGATRTDPPLRLFGRSLVNYAEVLVGYETDLRHVHA